MVWCRQATPQEDFLWTAQTLRQQIYLPLYLYLSLFLYLFLSQPLYLSLDVPLYQWCVAGGPHPKRTSSGPLRHLGSSFLYPSITSSFYLFISSFLNPSISSYLNPSISPWMYLCISGVVQAGHIPGGLPLDRSGT